MKKKKWRRYEAEMLQKEKSVLSGLRDRVGEAPYAYRVQFENYPPRLTVRVYITSEDARRLEEMTGERKNPTVVANPTDEELGVATDLALKIIEPVVNECRVIRKHGVVFTWELRPKGGYQWKNG